MVKLNLLERFLNRIHARPEQIPTISTFAMDLPGSLSAQSSNISDKQTQLDLPPLMLDDTLNNDFFYDEEFAVPFDANLMDDCQSLPAEFDALLRQFLPVGGDGSNQDWRRVRLALSKSDSCLYQADQELSDSEREMSTSDHDCSCSSNNSPLQNQSLFSSNGEPAVVDVCVTNADNNSDSMMSESLTRDPDRYNYDWAENKAQYVLLFDHSLTKPCSSEEESCHQMAESRAKITCWSKTKSSDKPEEKIKEQTWSQNPDGKLEKEKNLAPPVPSFTTWGQVKSVQQSNGCVIGGLTTWQKVKESSHTAPGNLYVGKKVVTPRDDNRMETVLEELSTPPDGDNMDFATAVTMTSSDGESHSRKLLNFYCKMKTQEEMNGFENNEAMASPLPSEKLLETWTESLMLPECGLDAAYDRACVDSITSKEHGQKGFPSSLSVAQKQGDRSGSEVVWGPTSCDCKAADISSKPADSSTTAEQAGSPVVTSSLLRAHDTVDCSIQFPPASVDQSVQTSLLFSGSQTSVTESKSQQTSVIASVSMPQSSSTTVSPTDPKMIRSAHLLNRPLPDLSFLKKGGNVLGAKRAEENAPGAGQQTEGKRNSDSEEVCGNCKRKCQAVQVMNEVNLGKTPSNGHAVDVKAFGSNESRDSSPRPVIYRNRSRSSDSTSTYSVCSTSSSGIDPGFCDSSGSGTRTPRMSRIFDDADSNRTTPVPAMDSPKIPPKPPRLFTALSETQLPQQFGEECVPLQEGESRNANEQRDQASGLCQVCNSQISFDKRQFGSRNLSTSHPAYFRDSPDRVPKMKEIDYLQVSPTRSQTPALPQNFMNGLRRQNNESNLSLCGGSTQTLRVKDHVTLRKDDRQPPKPAKSILVRRRQKNQTKRRSWSNPTFNVDDLGTRPGYLPNYLTADGRPVSLPDENLLHPAPGSLEENDEDQDHRQKMMGHDFVSEEIGEETPLTDASQENRTDEEECEYERFKAKKSVSFSEKIFYHSTSASASPLDSPKCPQLSLLSSCQAASSSSLIVPKTTVDCKKLADNSNFKSDSDDAEMPPTDFMVSPNMSPSVSLSNSEVSLSTDILHKRELVFDVMRAVEVLVKYFSQTRDVNKKVRLGSTVENGEIGRLVLEHLCPAIHAVVLDGLKPHVNSLFGKVKNSACKVMEDSAELGQPIELIQGLVRSLKSLKFLNTPWLLFNAFVFGLLNYKALDFWLTYIHNHKTLQAKHYTTSSFLHLNNSAAHRLFLDMITSLQPLAQMPFRLEYSFETRMLERRQQEQLAEYLLDRHVSRSMETYIEGQQFLTQMQNLSSSQQAMQQDELLSGTMELPLKQRTRELWQNAQRHLVEKLSQSKERLANESTTFVRSVARAATSRRPRPLSLPGTFRDAELQYGGSAACVSSVRSLAHGEGMELLGSDDAGQMVESTESSGSEAGFFLRLTKQLRDMNLRDKVYKKGSTEYSFEESSQNTDAGKENLTALEKFDDKVSVAARGNGETEAPPSGMKIASVSHNASRTAAAVPLDSSQSQTSKVDAVSPRLVKASASSGNPVASSTSTEIPANKSASLSGSSISTDAAYPGNAQVSHDSLPSSLASRTHSSSSLNGSMSRKRWSDIGSRIVNIFDRLLLSDDTKTICSSPSTSSVDKCPSVGNIDGVWQSDSGQGAGKARGQWSSSVHGNHFVRTSSLDSAGGGQAKTKNTESASRNFRQARTLCHFVATDSQQLSFEKGTSVVVLQECNADWKLCRLGQNVGLVHNACIRTDIEGNSDD